LFGAAALALFIPSAGGAVQPSAPAVRGDPIVVTGEALSESAIRQRVAEFIRGTGVASGETPAARWTDPVCPRVIGLADQGAHAAVARMRAIAEEAGIEVAPEPCDANIIVTFTSDAGALVREINRLAPSRLGNVPSNQRPALLSGTAPIRWWYLTETRGRDGEIQGGSPQARSDPATHTGSGDGSSLGGSSIMQYDSSIISTLSTRVLTGASVVIDQDDVMGMRLSDLAAYAALVSFAEIRSGDAAPPGSILSLFAAPGSIRGLTMQDKAFLRALYHMPLDRDARRHRGMLTGEMVDAARGKTQADN
jgi:hypothetical protein